MSRWKRIPKIKTTKYGRTSKMIYEIYIEEFQKEAAKGEEKLWEFLTKRKQHDSTYETLKMTINKQNFG